MLRAVTRVGTPAGGRSRTSSPLSARRRCFARSRHRQGPRWRAHPRRGVPLGGGRGPWQRIPAPGRTLGLLGAPMGRGEGWRPGDGYVLTGASAGACRPPVRSAGSPCQVGLLMVPLGPTQRAPAPAASHAQQVQERGTGQDKEKEPLPAPQLMQQDKAQGQGQGQGQQHQQQKLLAGSHHVMQQQQQQQQHRNHGQLAPPTPDPQQHLPPIPEQAQAQAQAQARPGPEGRECSAGQLPQSFGPQDTPGAPRSALPAAALWVPPRLTGWRPDAAPGASACGPERCRAHAGRTPRPPPRGPASGRVRGKPRPAGPQGRRLLRSQWGRAPGAHGPRDSGAAQGRCHFSTAWQRGPQGTAATAAPWDRPLPALPSVGRYHAQCWGRFTGGRPPRRQAHTWGVWAQRGPLRRFP